MRKLIWTEPALADLEAIYDFIAKDSEYYASSFLEEIIQQPEKLIDFPEIGRIVPEADQNDIRELIFQNYRIIYQLDDEIIMLLTVIHAKRELVFTEEK